MRLFWSCFAAALSAALLSAAAVADEVAVLKMDFYYGGTKIADTTETLTFADGAYEIKSHAAAVGLAKLLHGDVTLESRGVLDDEQGLRMTAYYQKRGRRSEQRARLSAAGDVLQLQRGDEAREEAVTLPVFDYLTAVYRSFAVGKPVGGTLAVTNGWRLRDYVYTVEGEETVETGMGDMKAVLLSRTSERGARKVWLAPALDYLPVRLYVNDKGHEFETIAQDVSLQRQ